MQLLLATIFLIFSSWPGLAGAGELGEKVTSFLQLKPVMEVQICDAEPLSNCKKAEDLDHMLSCLAKMREAMKSLQDADFVVSTEKHRITKEIHLGVSSLREGLDIKHQWDQTMRECVQEGKP